MRILHMVTILIWIHLVSGFKEFEKVIIKFVQINAMSSKKVAQTPPSIQNFSSPQRMILYEHSTSSQNTHSSKLLTH